MKGDIIMFCFATITFFFLTPETNEHQQQNCFEHNLQNITFMSPN